MREKIITRYGITCIDGNGDRVLTYPHRADELYDTEEEAECGLVEILTSNTPKRVRETLGSSPEVSAIDCYESGDPANIYPEKTYT